MSKVWVRVYIMSQVWNRVYIMSYFAISKSDSVVFCRQV